MIEFTTIRKKIKEFDVLISNDPKEFNEDEDIDYKNLLRVYCRNDGYYATFLMSKDMLKELAVCDDFIYKMLNRQFEKLKLDHLL